MIARPQLDPGSEIQRASHLFEGLARNAMGIDHRGPDIAVAQKLLDRADVVIGLQKMRRERVPERVAGDSLGQFSLSDGFVKRLLDMRFVKMISTPLLRIRHEGQRRLREKPLPGDILPWGGIFLYVR